MRAGLLVLIAAATLVVSCASPACPRPTPANPGPPNTAVGAHSSAAHVASASAVVPKRVNENEPSWPNVTVQVEEALLGDVMRDITRKTGKLIYFADPAIMTDERVTISLTNVRWDDAVKVITIMAKKTPFTYRDGAFIDWACTDWPEPPDWSSVERLGSLPPSTRTGK